MAAASFFPMSRRTKEPVKTGLPPAVTKVDLGAGKPSLIQQLKDHSTSNSGVGAVLDVPENESVTERDAGARLRRDVAAPWVIEVEIDLQSTKDAPYGQKTAGAPSTRIDVRLRGLSVGANRRRYGKYIVDRMKSVFGEWQEPYSNDAYQCGKPSASYYEITLIDNVGKSKKELVKYGLVDSATDGPDPDAFVNTLLEINAEGMTDLHELAGQEPGTNTFLVNKDVKMSSPGVKRYNMVLQGKGGGGVPRTLKGEEFIKKVADRIKK